MWLGPHATKRAGSIALSLVFIVVVLISAALLDHPVGWKHMHNNVGRREHALVPRILEAVPAAPTARNYRWMWGDAGNHLLGHKLAELDPWRWSSWQDRKSTIENLKSYNIPENQHRPIEMVIGKGIGNHVTFDNIHETLNYLDPPKKKASKDSEGSNVNLVPLLLLGTFVCCAFAGCLVFCWIWHKVPKTSNQDDENTKDDESLLES